MSYIVLFALIIGGCVLGAPIVQESLRFRFVECILSDNETSQSQQVLEILDVNQTCIRVNKSSSAGNEVYLYIAPQTVDGVQLRLTTENCSTPLPELHLSLCDDNELNDNSTVTLATFAYSNVTDIDAAHLDDNNKTSTEETFTYTGPTVYETLHHLDLDATADDAENSVTDAPSIVNQETTERISSSSEED